MARCTIFNATNATNLGLYYFYRSLIVTRNERKVEWSNRNTTGNFTANPCTAQGSRFDVNVGGDVLTY